MNNSFGTKVDDFVEWSKLSFFHLENKHYADSLTNMRKCAEVACKLIILNQFHEKRALEKISQKSLKELIVQIIKDNSATRNVINSLETDQSQKLCNKK